MNIRRIALVAAAGAFLLATAAVDRALAADPTSGTIVPKLGLGVGQSQLILGPGKTTGSFVVGNGGVIEASVALSIYDFVIDANGVKTPTAAPGPLGASA